MWSEIIEELSSPYEASFRGYLPHDTIPSGTYPTTMSSERIGEIETSKIAARFHYDSILGAATARRYRLAYDGVYCDGEIVPKLRTAAQPVWYLCDGTLVIAEAKGGYDRKSLDAILAMGYKYRQGTIEWARKAGDSLLVASRSLLPSQAPNAAQVRATNLFFDFLRHGEPVRVEVVHADYRSHITRYYIAETIYPP